MKRFAQERIKRWLRLVLHTQDTPERTSLAFSLGVFIAFLPPVPWLHTLLALVLAFVFRLNRLATLFGTYINTPFTFLPVIAVELSVGLLVLGGEEPPELAWRQLHNWQGWKDALLELKPFLAPLMLGCVVLGLIAAAAAYMISLRLIPIYRKRVGHHAQAPPPGKETADSPARSPRRQESAREGGLLAEAPSPTAVDARENNS